MNISSSQLIAIHPFITSSAHTVFADSVANSLSSFIGISSKVDLFNLHELLLMKILTIKLNVFQELNLDFADLLKPDIFDAITLLLGPDLALQSKPNLSINAWRYHFST